MRTITATFEEAIENGLKGKDGTIYKFNSELATARYFKSQEWLIELQYGVPVEDFGTKLNELIEFVNQSKLYNVAIEIEKMLQGLQLMSQRVMPAAKITMLYFDSEGEDSSKFDEAKIMEKVKNLDHYSYYTFFALLLRCLNLSREQFNKIAEKAAEELLTLPLEKALQIDSASTETTLPNSTTS